MPRAPLTLLRRSQSLPPPRPVYPLSTAFGILGTKAQRRHAVQSIITQALIDLSPEPQGLPRNYMGHTLTRPKINTGASQESNSGMWFQRCYDHPECDEAYHALTPALDYDTLQLPWLQDLFAIRREVAPRRRGGRTVVVRRINQRQLLDESAARRQHNILRSREILTESAAEPAPQLRLPQDAATPSSVISGTVSTRARTVTPASIVKEDPLDVTVPVNIVAWAADFDSPTHLTLYPRSSTGGQLYLRLDDFEALFKRHGFGPDLELYLDDSYRLWIPFPFDQPIPIYQQDIVIILRARGVHYLEDFPL
ncbi:hypothetical protein B0H15DRAFT_807284 [Mycena belliarum]|uniref:Uncharacterized protein n=1 Tax=Mycena belliarum TaxID=1033014 RepID=A0AAD6TR45_9AGAR|nr:hypothetical protein B0H15DRAFT_807284 [Mycena belliae]